MPVDVRVALVCLPFFPVRAGSAIGNRYDSGAPHRSDEVVWSIFDKESADNATLAVF